MMALIGASIGVAFAASMVLAPVLNHWIGMSGIFVLTAVLASIGLLLLFVAVPNPVVTRFHRDAELAPGSLGGVLRNTDLLRLDAGIFILHFSLMCAFLVLPLMLRDIAGLAALDHWKVYLPMFVGSLLIMLPFIIIAERKQKLREVFLGAIAVLALALAGLSLSADMVGLVAALLMFFAAFNLLEASLPALVSKTTSATSKGTAMGVYSSSQFMGAFFGGLAGGAAHGHWGPQGALYTALAAVCLWLAIAVFMRKPRQLSTYLLNLGEHFTVDEATLIAIPGVAEAAIIAEENIAYLKVERHILDEEKLLSFAGSK